MADPRANKEEEGHEAHAEEREVDEVQRQRFSAAEGRLRAWVPSIRWVNGAGGRRGSIAAEVGGQLEVLGLIHDQTLDTMRRMR